MGKIITYTETNVRNYGIDALRILSMFMVLVLHVLGAGGVMENCEPFSISYVSAWTLEVAAYCAVNCYGLISGYVGIYSKYRYTNIVILWLQVVLYSAGCTLVFYLLNPGSVGGLRLINSFFPVTHDYFWYFSAYFGVYLFIPMLNRAVLSMSRNQAKMICLVIVVVFSAFAVTINGDPYVMKAGYSVLWLMVLYILGACVRKFEFLSNIKSIFLVFGYLFCVVISVGFKLFVEADCIPFLKIFLNEFALINYTSPTILFCGVSLLLIFSRWRRIPRCIVKVISLVSPLAFSVYIIHMQEDIKKILFNTDLFKFIADLVTPLMVVVVLLCAISIFVACALIDKLRLLLFEKLRIRQHLLRLEEKWIGNLWND